VLLNVLVELDFDDEVLCDTDEEQISLKASVLDTIAASRLKLTAFSVTEPGIIALKEAVEALDHDLGSCMHSLRSFSFAERNVLDFPDVNARRLIGPLLGPVVKLRNLTLDLGYDVFEGEYSHPDPSITNSLLTNPLSQLESLELIGMVVAEADLVTALSRCRSTLLRLKMSSVGIVGSDSPWSKAFSVLSSMPCLLSVDLRGLQLISTDSGYITLHIVVDGQRVPCQSMVYEGRNSVVAGLKKLSTATLDIMLW
jgi:hypothetical protein